MRRMRDRVSPNRRESSSRAGGEGGRRKVPRVLGGIRTRRGRVHERNAEVRRRGTLSLEREFASASRRAEFARPAREATGAASRPRSPKKERRRRPRTIVLRTSEIKVAQCNRHYVASACQVYVSARLIGARARVHVLLTWKSSEDSPPSTRRRQSSVFFGHDTP